MSSDHLLYLFLARSCPALCLLISDTGVLRNDLFDNNLIIILLVYMGINCPWALLVGTTIPGSFWVFVRYSEAKFVLDRCISYYLKEVFKRQEIFAFSRKPT
jgi:hypothetical protein